MHQKDVTRGEVVKGAGLVGLGRASGVIEFVAQPLYIWLFGLATYGLYVVLWGSINFITNVINLSLPLALQRQIPAEESEEHACATVKAALLISVLPALLLALLVTLNAAWIASFFSAAPQDQDALPRAVAVFIWGLPLWIVVEVSTAAVRARRAFGAEVRVRILWEQSARILFALLFFTAGLETTALIAAHLCSLILTAALALRLLGRFYDLRLVASAPMPRNLLRGLLGSAFALLPSNLSRRLLIDGPPVILNLMLPGAAGAASAGLFEIGRKISTVPYIVRQSFQYVLAPLSAAQARADRAAIGPLYRFASRVSAALVVPLSGLLVFAGGDILSIYRDEAAAALPLLYILVAARAVEAMAGPAATIIESIGHRGLPLLNSLLSVGTWAILTAILAPNYGAIGITAAVALATVVSAYAPVVELRLTEGLSPFDRKLLVGLAVSLAGVVAMYGAKQVAGGPPGFLLVLGLWGATTWLALRFGLTAEDRSAFGSLARRLRLLA